MVQIILLDELYPFSCHPFKAKDDKAMQDTVESVKAYGMLVAGIAQSRDMEGHTTSQYAEKAGAIMLGFSHLRSRRKEA